MKTLEKGQVVQIQGITHKVKDTVIGFFMFNPNRDNDYVFEKLGLDPYDFCSQFYTPCTLGGSWPYASDLESLTQCVEALINYKAKDLTQEPPVPFEVGDEVVWLLHGAGVVVEVGNVSVEVRLGDYIRSFTLEGKYLESYTQRALFHKAENPRITIDPLRSDFRAEKAKTAKRAEIEAEIARLKQELESI